MVDVRWVCCSLPSVKYGPLTSCVGIRYPSSRRNHPKRKRETSVPQFFGSSAFRKVCMYPYAICHMHSSIRNIVSWTYIRYMRFLALAFFSVSRGHFFSCTSFTLSPFPLSPFFCCWSFFLLFFSPARTPRRVFLWFFCRRTCNDRLLEGVPGGALEGWAQADVQPFSVSLKWITSVFKYEGCVSDAKQGERGHMEERMSPPPLCVA